MRRYDSPAVGRPPKSSSHGVSKSMKANRSSGTKPEIVLSMLLRKMIRKNDLPGSPDFVYPRKKVAVFLHGCFWHRCPRCNFRLPKTNREFWARKFERNVERDRLVRTELEAMGWRVVEIWEHELKVNPSEARSRVRAATSVNCPAEIKW